MEALGRRPDSPATWAGRRRRPGTVRTGPGELRCPGGCTCTHRQDHAHGQAPWPSTAASRRGGTAYTGRTELPALQGPLLLDSAPEGGGGRAAGLWLQRRHQGCVGLTAWAPGSVSWGLPATHVVCAWACVPPLGSPRMSSFSRSLVSNHSSVCTPCLGRGTQHGTSREENTHRSTSDTSRY
ncbi:PREDICTED: uncharacterized protein LOC106146682 isoform X4 [Chinchilla lanigera]|uniref:uncharacterized protein LOC106146682 isoform X4 n=1 Tax=Chinchilla lanigera TaxID=34839 RepID=UPI0006981AF2|nr:PREDICTED: uncharacterized protein LOC106146682 isoform X4 [Chinchilla lanigera]